jgi:hypothetical protein
VTNGSMALVGMIDGISNFPFDLAPGTNVKSSLVTSPGLPRCPRYFWQKHK